MPLREVIESQPTKLISVLSGLDFSIIKNRLYQALEKETTQLMGPKRCQEMHNPILSVSWLVTLAILMFEPSSAQMAPLHEGCQCANYSFVSQPLKSEVVHRPGLQMAVTNFFCCQVEKKAASRMVPQLDIRVIWQWMHGLMTFGNLRGSLGERVSNSINMQACVDNKCVSFCLLCVLHKERETRKRVELRCKKAVMYVSVCVSFFFLNKNVAEKRPSKQEAQKKNFKLCSSKLASCVTNLLTDLPRVLHYFILHM